MNIKDVIRTLEHIAVYLEIKGENSFKVAAYRKAAQALETEQRTLTEIDDPISINGIGKATAEVINELKETGKSSLLEELKQELPTGLIALLSLPGLGGKKIGKLFREIGVTDIESLKQACLEKKVQTLAGFGKKTEEKIMAAVKEIGTRPERLVLPYVISIVEQIETSLSKMDKVQTYSRAGSFRRLREDVKDLDFIIATEEPNLVRDEIVAFPFITNVIAKGDTKVSVEVTGTYPVSVDFRLVKMEEFATTLHHFTGSKDHNVKLRQLAKKRGEKISEYGVENVDTGEVKTFLTEAEFFSHFQLSYIPPEARKIKER